MSTKERWLRKKYGGVETAIFAGQEDGSRVPQQSEYIETQKDRKRGEQCKKRTVQ